jgi:hypothetical protein
MLSGALVGLLRVGAVALAAGGLGAGVYFVAQSGGDEDTDSSVQAPATETLTAPTALSPPSSAPTADATLEPTAALPAVDTSDWKTYDSPLGFTLKYPPDWTVEMLNDKHVRFVNPRTVQAQEDAISQGWLYVGRHPLAGEAGFGVQFGAAPGFNVDILHQSCEQPPYPEEPGHTRRAENTTFLGLKAVRCSGTSSVRGYANRGDTSTVVLESIGETYWVEYPQASTMTLGGGVVLPSNDDVGVISAILSSFELTEDP